MKKKTLSFISLIFISLSLSLFAILSSDDERINANIGNYTPAYIRLEDHNYYIRIKLEKAVNVNPTPWSNSKYQFLGYTDDNTKVVITEPMGFSPRAIAKVSLTPGVHTINDVEIYPYGKANITITIQPSMLPIKVQGSGYLWNSYENAHVYIISIKALFLEWLESKSYESDDYWSSHLD